MEEKEEEYANKFLMKGMFSIFSHYKNKLPLWLNSNDDLSLVLTNDIDSWLSCSILESIKGWKIDAFMDFRVKDKPIDRYYIRYGADRNKETVGVDYDRRYGKCIGNHITRFSDRDFRNPEAVNINDVCKITRQNYGDKCILSTALLLWSYFNLPVKELSEELKKFLLAVDGSYSGYFAYNGKYRHQIENYLLNVFDMPELYECLERHVRRDFVEVINKYHIAGEKSGIHVSIFNRKLYTYIEFQLINELLRENGIDFSLELPGSPFFMLYECKDVYEKISDEAELSLNNEKIISVVLTGYRDCVYSIRKKEEGIA